MTAPVTPVAVALPPPPTPPPKPTTTTVDALPRIGGLHHRYAWRDAA